MVEEVAARWSLTVGEPFPTSSVSWAAPATAAGRPAVLKVQWPHAECEHEALALATWAGDGAVRLLAHDPGRHALLLERCEPGTTLAAAGDPDPLAAFVDLLPRLWVAPPAALRTLADEARAWRASMPGAWERAGRPCERRLVDAACSLVDDLLADPPAEADHVLVHQDLHAENVLAADRRPWLAIDPKPLAGERAFACAPIVRDPDLGHGRADVLGRLDRLTSELGLDRERARAWTVVQTTAWSFTSTFAAEHHQTVRWLLEGC
ncbi:MAG: phosphotransferase [Acidimicrobiales bacterium]|nr:phosphotransferase [Acidimicrobiales bacterium]HRW37635.1 aminoglycoside phosphotransferase family protein [Aquihabitans sp.]